MILHAKELRLSSNYIQFIATTNDNVFCFFALVLDFVGVIGVGDFEQLSPLTSHLSLSSHLSYPKNSVVCDG